MKTKDLLINVFVHARTKNETTQKLINLNLQWIWHDRPNVFFLFDESNLWKFMICIRRNIVKRPIRLLPKCLGTMLGPSIKSGLIQNTNFLMAQRGDISRRHFHRLGFEFIDRQRSISKPWSYKKMSILEWPKSYPVTGFEKAGNITVTIFHINQREMKLLIIIIRYQYRSTIVSDVNFCTPRYQEVLEMKDTAALSS